LLWSGKEASQSYGMRGEFSLGSVGVALIACVLAYDGWVQLSFVAGEIKNPQRNVLLSLAIGLGICIVIYLLANIAYMRVLSIPEIAFSDHVGANAAERVLGRSGGKLVALAILMSIIGTLNGCFLTIPRIYFAQARDGLFFRRFAEVHPVHKTPSFAILAQAPWAAVLLLSGSYESLLDFSMYANWLSYAATVAAVIVLRIRQPDLPRPYRMWGYPVTPVLFIVVTFWFLANMTLKRPVPSFAALLLIITGIPVFLLWVHLQRASL
jgi:APA family basic amino acid/polyamine antiporter